MIVRRIGSGDREHVRIELLNVGLFCGPDVTEQLTGAIAAADELRMMLRAHVNAERVMSAGLYNLMHRNTHHQLEGWYGRSRKSFESIFSKLDLLILSNESAKTVQEEILSTWGKHGGRFLKGNFGHLSDEVLMTKYPEMYPDSTKYWEAWHA